MAAQTTDLFRKTGAGTVTTLAAPGKALSATSITVGATTNYPTDTGLVIAIRIVDSAGELVAGTYTEWNAIVASGTSFTIEAAPVYGSDQVYPAGSTTQVFIPLSSSAHNDLIDGILTHADQDGTLKAGAVDVAAVLATDVVETAKIKDLNITTAKIADANVTPAKWTNPYKFSAYKSSGTQTINTGSSTKITFDAESFDTNNNFATSTYTAPVAGFYCFIASVGYNAVGSGTRIFLDLFKNGAAIRRGEDRFTNALSGAASLTCFVQLAANDTIEIYGTPVGANTVINNSSAPRITQFEGFLVSQT